MAARIVFPGTFTNQVFVPDGPMPKVEGRAELIVYEQAVKRVADSRSSIFDCFGKAERLRSAEDIDAQLREERESWDRP